MFKVAFAAALACFSLAASAADIATSVQSSALAKSKRTTLGLYLTPADAHTALEADPGIVFLDVRDPVEVSFVGHASSIDANVPLSTATREFDVKGGRYKMAPNKDFIEQAIAVIAREGGGFETPVFVICRSGSRSARAAELLIKAGYLNVWNVVEGFEGDLYKATGARSINGWRNAGLPWRYKLAETQAWRPAE